MSVDFSDEKADPEDGRFIGKSICREINIKLNNKANELNLENKEVEYYLGAEVDGEFFYINFGKFIVQKPENQEVNEEMIFTAFDYMGRFDVKYNPNISFPATLGDIVQDICNQCGVELGSTEFRNSEKVIESNPFLNAEQCREVIKSIAKVSFSIAHIGQDNKLYFGFEKNDDITETINIDNYFELGDNNIVKPFNVITLRSGEVEASGQSIRDLESINQYGINELIIEEDYFAFTDELRQSFLEEASYLFGLTYTPIDIDLEGSAYLNFNDVIKIQNLNGEEKITYALNNYHTYNGVLYNSVSVPALTESEKKYTYKDEDSTKRTKTAIEIDKANARIDMVVKQINDTEQKLAETNINIDGIKDTVYTKDEVKEITEELKRDIEGVTNTLTEKGGNNLIYYDKDYWIGKSKVIPDEYEKVKSIRSTGTQYIDIDYIPKISTKLEIDLRFDGTFDTTGKETRFIGVTDDDGKCFAFNFGGDTNQNNNIFIWTDKAYDAGGTIYKKDIPNTILRTKQRFIVESGTFTYGTTSDIEIKTSDNVRTLCLFGSNEKGSYVKFGAYEMIMYGCKIYEGGVLVRDLIPCIRTTDNKTGLYDVVGEKFYPNKGVLEFEYEYDIPEEYQEVQYLESDGNQYIDTGHIFTGGTTFDLDIMETKHGNSEWCMFIGVRDAGLSKQLIMSCNTAGVIGGDYGNVGSALQGGDVDLRNNLIHISTKSVDFEYRVYMNNNTVYGKTSYQNFNSGLNGYLFGFNVDGNAHMREAHFRIYRCKIYENSVLVRDFIPCYKKETNITGFYDKLNDVFYPNNGTGNFALGEYVKEEGLDVVNEIEEYTDTEIKNNTISGVGYLLNNGQFEQSINDIINGIYTISFKYKKIKELAIAKIVINDVQYELTETEWDNFAQTIEVSSNSIKIVLFSDTNSSCYIADILINIGDVADIWTQNPNETRTDTVKIGKGIQVDSTTTNTYHRIDSDGNRTYNKQTGEVVSEQTDKGTRTKYLEAKEGEIAKLLIQQITYEGSEQIWLSSLL